MKWKYSIFKNVAYPHTVVIRILLPLNNFFRSLLWNLVLVYVYCISTCAYHNPRLAFSTYCENYVKNSNFYQPLPSFRIAHQNSFHSIRMDGFLLICYSNHIIRIQNKNYKSHKHTLQLKYIYIKKNRPIVVVC